MGFRDAIKDHRFTAITMFVALTLIVFWIAAGMRDSSEVNAGVRKAWFTDDDGKTWFADDATKIPPFEHNGKQAVACFVYRCSGGSPFVSHLLRHTPEGKKMMEADAKGVRSDLGSITRRIKATEVKRPGTGETGWISIDDAKARAIQELKCPDGSTAKITPVEPRD